MGLRQLTSPQQNLIDCHFNSNWNGKGMCLRQAASIQKNLNVFHENSNWKWRKLVWSSPERILIDFPLNSNRKSKGTGLQGVHVLALQSAGETCLKQLQTAAESVLAQPLEQQQSPSSHLTFSNLSSKRVDCCRANWKRGNPSEAAQSRFWLTFN